MTDYVTGIAEAGRAFTPILNGQVGYRRVSFTTEAALTTADVLKAIPVYAGETVLDVVLSVQTDLDTDESPALVLAVGDGDDVDRYISGSTVGQAGGVARLGDGVVTAAQAAKLPHRYTEDDTIDIVATTNATASVAVGTYELVALIAS